MFESHFSTMFESRLNGKTFPSSTMFDENVWSFSRAFTGTHNNKSIN
jgi:hypothetical protein